MSDKSTKDRCPLCGGTLYINIDCMVKCDDLSCNYEVNETIHAEICAALAYYSDREKHEAAIHERRERIAALTAEVAQAEEREEKAYNLGWTFGNGDQSRKNFYRTPYAEAKAAQSGGDGAK